MEKLLGGLPVRQFVLSMPFELRFLMARDSKLMSLVLAIVNRSITRLYRKMAKAELGLDADYTTGAVTFIQRYGSSLNLNIHFHILAIEGVWNKNDAKTLSSKKFGN
jgi:transcription initiation factor TFIIIB Brf1 subunit/transcription initiation factor TFIIB